MSGVETSISFHYRDCLFRVDKNQEGVFYPLDRNRY